MLHRLLLLVSLGMALAPRVHAEPLVDKQPRTRLYVLAIGHNGLPPGGDPRLRELHYADDDAAAFGQLARDLGGHAIVLSNFDTDTARRFPRIAREARPPLHDEMQRAVAELNRFFERDRGLGIEPVLLFTYSGHGVVAQDAPPALTLADGAFTQETLYSEVLAPLKARFLHVIVDACHAEAVVRPRDVQAETVALDPGEVHSQWSRATLGGMPHVGALVASTASAQSHEWDAWQQGVFTHEVISGLRGAADVNGDLRVEYSEMAAFLSAINREVWDSTARIRPLVKPPSAAPRTPIVDLHRISEFAFLVGRPEGIVSVETEEGERVADLRTEQRHYVRLLVPSGRRLFVRGKETEAEVMVAAGEQIGFDKLSMRTRGLRSRGALDLSLQRGLFATPYGPAYYRGFVDNTDELVAVPLRAPRADSGSDAMTRATDTPPSALAWTSLGVSGALLITAASFGVAALVAEGDFEDADGRERASLDAAQRRDAYRAISIGTLIGSAVTGGLAYVLFTQD